MNPFLRNPKAFKRTPVRAEVPAVKSTDGGVATLRLYDPIDSWGEFWGVSAKEFVATLDELPDDTSEIRLLINSPGGEIWDAMAILNSLRSHPARVTAVVEGIAASAASVIAAGVDELYVMEGAELMVHKAWGMAIGNGDDMAKMATDLDHEDRNLAAVYARKSGGTVDEWLAIMAAETWFTAQEAADAGLADRVVEPATVDDDAAKVKARFDLSIFAYAGRSHAPAPQTPTAAEAVAEEEEGLMPTLQEALRERLGITADDATEETILSALDEALAERADDDAGSGDPTAEQVTAAAARMGLTLVDRAQYDATVAAAEQGRQARAQQMREADERLVDARIRDGAVPVARRDHWLAALAADRDGTAATLNGLPKGLIPLAEVGHSQEVSEDVTADARYKEWSF